MVGYRRWHIPGGCYFFTVTLLNRREQLLMGHVDKLRNAFCKVKQRYPFEINAIVIMPEHLHCIWTLPEDNSDYSIRWREIKSAFSRALPKNDNRNDTRHRRNERGIWQRRFWEHVIRDEKDYQRHVDYIHFNPVKHGYVNSPREWEFSSFHSFVREGIYPPDWAGSDTDLDIG